MKNLSMKFMLLALSLVLSACKEQPKFKLLPTGPIKHQLIVAAKTATGVRAQGFAGATPEGTKVFFESGGKHKIIDKTIADGSFVIELSATDKQATHGEFIFELPTGGQPIPQLYKLKELAEALPKLAKDALVTPPEVDQVSINNNEALILSTVAAQLRRININPDYSLADSLAASILLNPKAEKLLSPRSVASRGRHAVVTMFDSHELALIDLSNNKLITKAVINRPEARSAEQIIALDDKTYVASLVNFNKSTQTVDDPGVVALLRLANNDLKATEVLILPFKNPQFFKATKDNKALWVSCTGAYDLKAGGDLSAHNAGLVKLVIADDKEHFEPKSQEIPLLNFTPGAFELVGEYLVIPELWGNRLAVVKQDATELKPEDIKTPPGPHTFNFTVAAHWHDTIAFIGDATGTLVAYGLPSQDKELKDKKVDEGFFPFPFIEPIKINKDQDAQIKFVPHQVLFRHQATNTNYQAGFSAWVVSQVQSRVIPLDFLEIFGP